MVQNPVAKVTILAREWMTFVNRVEDGSIML